MSNAVYPIKRTVRQDLLKSGLKACNIQRVRNTIYTLYIGKGYTYKLNVDE